MQVTTRKVWKDEMRCVVNRRLSSGCPLNLGEKVHVLHIGNEHSFEEVELHLFES